MTLEGQAPGGAGTDGTSTNDGNGKAQCEEISFGPAQGSPGRS